MLLAYLLLFFLLHASTCDATSRNPRIFLHPGGRSDVGAPSPAIHDHRHVIAKDLFFEAYHPSAMMAAPPPSPMPSSPGIEDLRRPPDKDTSVATMAPSPSPSPSPPSQQAENNGGYYTELVGGGDVGGGDYGPPPSEATATDHEESSVDGGIGFDYAEPMTHPPSHN